MKTKTPFQAIALIVLLFSPFIANQPVSANSHILVDAQPYVATSVNPTSVRIGESAAVTVSLNNIPAEGYASAEFVCTYDSAIVEASNVSTANLFGADAVVASNGPQNGSLIVAIAGSNGNKATSNGTAFTFNVKGLMPAQVSIGCTVRVSTGNEILTPLPSLGSTLTILEITPTPTTTAEWLTFTNLVYGFDFKYPPQSQIANGNTNNFTRIDLPSAPSTNLSDKYLEVTVAENVTSCHSPLATSSLLQTSESVSINGIFFLKETGEDGSAGHIHKWTAYSTTHNNVCISLSFVLNIVNPGAFTTPPPLYDNAAETAVFGQIVSTYHQWLELIPTPTPTFIFTPTATPTATNTPKSTVYGQVIAAKVVTVRLYNLDQTLAASSNANPDGTFSFDVSPGTYSIVATANGFLRAEGTITLANGEVRSMPTIALFAGDIDDSNSIDQFDAMTIGFSYGTAEPSGADLNNDGVINALDLELLALNFRKTGPVIWQ